MMHPRTMAVPRSGCITMSSPAAGRDQEERPDDAPIGGAFVEPAGDQVGREDRQRQLHQLGGLQAELAEADPPARTLRVDPEAGHQHDEEEEEREPAGAAGPTAGACGGRNGPPPRTR